MPTLAMADKAASPHATLLACLYDLEHFIVDYSIARKSERARLQARTDEAFCCADEWPEAQTLMLQDNGWRTDPEDRTDLNLAVTHAFNMAAAGGLLSDATYAEPEKVIQKIEAETVPWIRDELGCRLWVSFKAQIIEWLDADVRPRYAGSRRPQIRRIWLKKWRRAMKDDATRLAASAFQKRLCAYEKTRRGPAYRDDTGWRNLGPLQRFVHVWQNLRPKPERRTPHIWDSLLALHCLAVQAALRRLETSNELCAPAAHTLCAVAACRLAEIQTWNSAYWDMPDGSTRDGAPQNYLDAVDFQLEVGVLKRRDVLRHLDLLDAIELAQPEIADKRPAGESTEAPARVEPQKPRSRAKRKESEEAAWGHVTRFSKENNRPPTVRELAELVGCSEGMAATLEAFKAGKKIADQQAGERRELIEDLVGRERAHERSRKK